MAKPGPKEINAADLAKRGSRRGKARLQAEKAERESAAATAKAKSPYRVWEVDGVVTFDAHKAKVVLSSPEMVDDMAVVFDESNKDGWEEFLICFGLLIRKEDDDTTVKAPGISKSKYRRKVKAKVAIINYAASISLSSDTMAEGLMFSIKDDDKYAQIRAIDGLPPSDNSAWEEFLRCFGLSETEQAKLGVKPARRLRQNRQG